MSTRMFSEDQLEQLRSFPDVGKDELIQFFTLTPADVAFVGHWPATLVTGPDELATLVRHTHARFATLRFTLEVGPIVDGDFVAVRQPAHATTPDGPRHVVGADILRIRDGRILEYWPAAPLATP